MLGSTLITSIIYCSCSSAKTTKSLRERSMTQCISKIVSWTAAHVSSITSVQMWGVCWVWLVPHTLPYSWGWPLHSQSHPLQDHQKTPWLSPHLSLPQLCSILQLVHMELNIHCSLNSYMPYLNGEPVSIAFWYPLLRQNGIRKRTCSHHGKDKRVYPEHLSTVE